MRLLDDVKIICKEDESVTKIYKDYFEVQIVERREKKMGAEVHYVASLAYELDCSHEVGYVNWG